MSDKSVWTVEIVFTENGDRTRADARLLGSGRQFTAWGRARRNPCDPDVPVVGEELAAARALAALTNHLVHEAAATIELFAGRPVTLPT